MTRKIKILTAVSALMLLATVACKKSYTIGGSTFTAQVNMTTYDYLKTNHLFDTLVMMIDKAGLKDELNQAGTFFAFSNYSIRNYVNAKGDDLRIIRNNENMPYTFDSLNLPALKDSLRSYMFTDRFTRDNITRNGLWRPSRNGEYRLMQLIPTTDYTNQNVFTTEPQYIYFTKIIALPGHPVPADSTQLPSVVDEQRLGNLCQTTGIITTTGVLHVLANSHTFNFYDNNH
ncbi:hypothetical protein A4D02_33515 [Niastella koreensis]|uniref:FAS1 domain-containing protein n=2 Tax=Niastella koreensis TaxID=354356 RepID=G8TAE7_NIAKG|nr:hypothetical protein [Niastella koreensis]AEV98109.1 hypothetical protein Niako_1746 [Niastella koreensis GR20-10]OQP45320.1 hypothetical protein A4D02_33515 [Niastella koreensis]